MLQALHQLLAGKETFAPLNGDTRREVFTRGVKVRPEQNHKEPKQCCLANRRRRRLVVMFKSNLELVRIQLLSVSFLKNLSLN